MWQERTGTRVDGVVTIDVAAVQDLLGVTGPITVEGTSYTQANVVNELLIGQYAGLGQQSAANDARHEKLAALAGAVFTAIDTGSAPLTDLAAAFDQAVDGRHLMVWSSAKTVEAGWSAAGAGGEVSGNDLLVSVLNQGGNKLDPYQKVTSALTTSGRGRQTVVETRVTVDNEAPSSLGSYAAGGGPGQPPPGTYTGAVSLDFPSSAGDVETTGGKLEAAGPDGTSQVVAIAIQVPAGQSRTVTIRFVLNGASGALTVAPSARLPATTWSFSGGTGPTTSFDDTTAHTVSW
jgi:hypothetical protein